MLNHSNRVSQDALADAITSAVMIENQRVEQLDSGVMEQVDGGGGRVQDVIDIILGLILGDGR